jgi:signal transduction histidine kinase
LFLLAVQLITQENNLWYQGLPVYVDYAALTICTGVAVLRHRLYDIDVIVNRAVLLAGAVVFVTAGYVGIVVAIGGSIPGFWPSVIATTVVALAFQPARRGLVRVADRLAYGPRAAPLEELAEFNRQIGESTDPTSLLPALAAAAAQAVGAAAVSVQLEVGSAKELRAQWPTSSADLVDPAVFAVLDGDDQLGSIAVVTRPGRPLRDRERALLTDLAAQAAPAFRNAALAARLTEQVDLLDVRSGELNRSRARLIAARDAERARIARTVRREVTPYLEDVEARLAADPDVDLDRMIGSVNAALDALRRITHGIFPVHLARSGLTAALRSQLTDTALVAGTDARFDRSVELTAYFCSVEAVELIEPPARVTVTDDSSALRIQVAGTAVRYNDLALLIDRLAPLGGQAQFADGAHVEIYIPTRVNALPTAIPASVVPG